MSLVEELRELLLMRYSGGAVKHWVTANQDAIIAALEAQEAASVPPEWSPKAHIDFTGVVYSKPETQEPRNGERRTITSSKQYVAMVGSGHGNRARQRRQRIGTKADRKVSIDDSAEPYWVDKHVDNAQRGADALEERPVNEPAKVQSAPLLDRIDALLFDVPHVSSGAMARWSIDARFILREAAKDLRDDNEEQNRRYRDGFECGAHAEHERIERLIKGQK